MKKNEYDPADAVEIGEASTLVLGEKINVLDFDSSGAEPLQWRYRHID
jgi:hypothetical protein